MEIDKSYLDTRTFKAFSETSKNQYIYLCNMQTNVSRWSKNAVEYFGLPDEYIADVEKVWAEYIHPDDRQAFIDDIADVLSGKKKRHEMEYRARNKDGSYVACICKGMVLKGADGEPDLFAGTIINNGIIDNIDHNTGLGNIYDFMDAARTLLEEKVPAGILQAGFNHFGEVNDIYGYSFGNAVLKEFGQRVKAYLGGSGRVFRMDGAKFAVFMYDMTQRQAKEIFAYMQDVAKNEIVINNVNISLSLSGGVVLVDSYTNSEHSILASVAYAFEKSKIEKHGELVFFDNSIQGIDKERIELMNAIRQSVIKNCSGFYLCYQPLVSDTDGKTIGMEALIRWKQDIYGEISPGLFIPWLENDTCFFELGNWIMRQALTDGKKIVDAYPDFIVNVNVSYTQLERSDFRSAVLNILKETGFPPQNLCIELTERCSNLNIDFLREELSFFRSYGIKIALDDFGTGSSSLNLLRELPIDCLKIDRTFIANIQTNDIDQAIVESVVQCAGKFGINICIEGVENKQISDFVKKYKAGTHQGYFYSRPVRIEEFVEML